MIDAVDGPSLARFWAAALDGYAVRPYDDAEIERLARQGLTPETDPAVAVDGPGPTLWFQKVEERKTTRNRIHLDLCGGPRSDEVARLLALGATLRDELEGHSVLLDPEGNELCVRDPDQD